jgi:signal transduction histidine kinase
MPSPLGFPLEPGSEIVPEEQHVVVRNLRLIDSAPTTSGIDRLREICHDMRQPVACILVLAEAALAELALAEVALAEAAMPSVASARLGQIREQAEWLGDLLEHLLEPHGTRAANGKSVELTQIASDVVQSEQVTYRGDIRLQWGGGNVSVRGNTIELRRAIANLLNNATRAAGPDGKVVVELQRVEGRVHLTVDDSGPGFGLIRRGIGLGLRAAARSLKSCGGHIEHSRSQLGGARATLVLHAIDS